MTFLYVRKIVIYRDRFNFKLTMATLALLPLRYLCGMPFGFTDLPSVTGITPARISRWKAHFNLYKKRERIHRSLLICDYYQVRLHAGELQPAI